MLRKCLAKDPDDRWQSARDLKDELEWVASASGEAAASSAPSRSRLGRLHRYRGGGAGDRRGGVLMDCVYRATRPAELKPLVRLDVDLGADVSLTL